MGKKILTTFLILLLGCNSAPAINNIHDEYQETQSTISNNIDKEHDQDIKISSNKPKNSIPKKVNIDIVNEGNNLNNCKRYKGVGTKISVTECLEINYAENSHPRQTLNLWIPCKINECNQKLFPLIIHIHGGGFKQGSKLEKPAAYILEEGFALASINYRLLPEYKFPDYLHDAKAAIRWLRGNEKKFYLNTSRIGVFGQSAGGSLTSYLAFSNGIKELTINNITIDIEGKVGNYLNQSSEIHAAINYFGHADAAKYCSDKQGADNCKKRYEQDFPFTSPILYIGKGKAVPYMIIHGTKDNSVPYIHGELLYNKFKNTYPNNNPELTFITIEDGGHGNWPNEQSTNKLLINANTNFFHRNINNNNKYPFEVTRTITK